MKVVNLEKPLRWDLSWIAKPKRGSKYTIDEWSKVKGAFFRLSHSPSQNASKDFSELVQAAWQADRFIEKQINFESKTLNSFHSFLPNNRITGEHGYLSQFYYEFKNSSYPIWAKLKFNFNDPQSRTYENLVEYFLASVGDVWDDCTKLIKNTTDKELWAAEDAQTFINVIVHKHKSKHTFKIEAVEAFLLMRFKEKFVYFDLSNVSDDKSVRKSVGFSEWNNTLTRTNNDYLLKGVLRGDLTLAEYRIIEQKANANKEAKYMKSAMLYREELTQAFEELYQSFVIKGWQPTIGNMTRSLTKTRLEVTSRSYYVNRVQNQAAAIEFKIPSRALFVFDYQDKNGAFTLVALAKAVKCMLNGDSYDTIMHKCNNYAPMSDSDYKAAMKETYDLLHPSVSKAQTLINDLKEALKYIKDSTKLKKYNALVSDLELAAKYAK